MTTVSAMNRRQFLMTMAATPIFMPGCSRQPFAQQAQIPVFGTLVDLLVYSPSIEQSQKAIQAVNQSFHQFHKEWHAWEKGGIVSKINEAISNHQSTEVAPSVKRFIVHSQKLCRSSQQLFDPGMGQLIDLWGFHSENWQGPPPSEEALNKWLTNRPSILDIYFEGLRLHSRNPNVQLDFGGNAKGLALDIASSILEQHQIKHALVSIGGDMKSLGLKPDQSPWKIGIQNPKNPNQVLARANLEANQSIVTSGTYQRFFEWQGKRFSHIINPNTAHPANGFASVTVIDHNATKADAAATALLIAGPEKWQQIAESMQIYKVFAITHEGKIHQSKKLGNQVKLL
jgi:thiamine biosynthesis lipoprotein